MAVIGISSGFPIPSETIGSISAHMGMISHYGGTFTSTTWPVANLAVYMPVRFTAPMLISQFWVHNGATATGNLDLGIYSEDGIKLGSTGSTAQSGTSVLQVIDVTDFRIAAGIYYLAMSHSSTSGTASMLGSIVANRGRLLGLMQEASALPLPANATFAQLAQSVFPFMGCTGRSI